MNRQNIGITITTSLLRSRTLGVTSKNLQPHYSLNKSARLLASDHTQSVFLSDLHDGTFVNSHYLTDALASKRIFAAVQTRNQLVTVNPKISQVVGRYDLPGCDHPHGLFIDSAHRMAYVACEDNAKLVAIALTNMQVISTHSVGSSPDVLAFDQDWYRLYVAWRKWRCFVQSFFWNTQRLSGAA